MDDDDDVRDDFRLDSLVDFVVVDDDGDEFFLFFENFEEIVEKLA